MAQKMAKRTKDKAAGVDNGPGSTGWVDTPLMSLRRTQVK